MPVSSGRFFPQSMASGAPNPPRFDGRMRVAASSQGGVAQSHRVARASLAYFMDMWNSTTDSSPKKALTFSLALAAVIVTIAGSAWASKKYILGSAEHRTQVSGKQGGTYGVANPSGPYQGLYELSAWEHVNRPCRLQVRSRHLNTYAGKNATWGSSMCDATKKTLTFANEDTYIGGIQVCLNGAGKRIKGIRIFGRKLNRATGQLAAAGKKEFERPNCNTWSPKRSCPAGQIATALAVYSGDGGATGLKLVCKPVVEK